MNTNTFGIIAILVAAVFAGCVGADEAAQPRAAGPSAEPSFSDETGAITGLVQTDEAFPISGAQVGVLELDVAVATDESGAFALNDLPPGKYSVVAQALGFESSAKKVDVLAGQAAPITFTLGPVASDDPSHTTDIQVSSVSWGVMWKLTPECIYTTVNPLVKTCGGARSATGGEKAYSDEGSDETWRTINAELDWEPQTGVTGRGFWVDVNAPNIERGTGGSINQADPKTFKATGDEAPLMVRVDNPTSLDEREIPQDDWYGDWFYRVFPAYCDLGNCEDGFGPDYGVMADAKATIYVSWFFKESAPPSWTALSDA